MTTSRQTTRNADPAQMITLIVLHNLSKFSTAVNGGGSVCKRKHKRILTHVKDNIPGALGSYPFIVLDSVHRPRSLHTYCTPFLYSVTPGFKLTFTSSPSDC